MDIYREWSCSVPGHGLAGDDGATPSVPSSVLTWPLGSQPSPLSEWAA